MPLVLAGLCGLAVAAFRTGCPPGAAGCGSGANETAPDLADTVHVYGVVGYEIALVTAMLAVAVRLARARPVAAALTVAAAVASVVQALGDGVVGEEARAVLRSDRAGVDDPAAALAASIALPCWTGRTPGVTSGEETSSRTSTPANAARREVGSS